ncbi:MAG: hypothetical protein R2746_03795 [Acidimicrobiales bacterium]|nr:hypothetical protein [Actinomycetota bacterium]
MAAPSAGPSGSNPNGMIPADWPVQAADKIVETIATVRDKTTRPALVAARAVVYGLLALVVGTIAFVVVITLLVRLYDVYVPGNVWPIYAVLAVAFGGGGLVLLKKANGPASAPS